MSVGEAESAHGSIRPQGNALLSSSVLDLSSRERTAVSSTLPGSTALCQGAELEHRGDPATEGLCSAHKTTARHTEHSESSTATVINSDYQLASSCQGEQEGFKKSEGK